MPKGAADDLVKIYWRHHAKRDIPPGLRGKLVAGEDLAQLANACCLVAEGILEEAPFNPAAGPALRRMLEDRRARKLRQCWGEREHLVPLVEKILSELSGDEWYYFWGLHQILDILPQTLEEK